MTKCFNYSAFGLRFRSEIRLPELLLAKSAAAADVTIRVAAVASGEDCPPGVHRVQDGLLLKVEKVANYWIGNGSEILVDPEPNVPEQNVRLYLLGSALGLLIHQRGLLPLHANCIEIGGAAFAFMGESGAGKSSLAAWFQDEGFRVVADDVCVVGFAGDGVAQAGPGVARLRLWRDFIDATGRDAAAYQASFHGAGAPDKFDVPIGSRNASDDPIPLAAIYLLQRSDKFEVERLTGVAAAEAIYAHTYRGGYVRIAGSNFDHWSACAKLVQSTPIFRAGRRWCLDELSTQCASLLGHALRVPRSIS